MDSYQNRLNQCIDFVAWNTYWASTDFSREPLKLPRALRDYSGRVCTQRLRKVWCPVLRGLLGLLSIKEQNRFANLWDKDPEPNRVPNRFSVAKLVVEQHRHPLVSYYKNPYDFLAAYQLAVTHADNFHAQFPKAVKQIRRSEAAKRRKDRRLIAKARATTVREEILIAGASRPETTTTTSSPSTATNATVNSNTSSDLPGSPPPVSPISISSIELPPSPAGYLESGTTTPAATPPQSPASVRDSTPSTPPPPYSEYDHNDSEILDFIEIAPPID